jgi:aldehyde:ferredoxin oxidoreductase
MGIEISLKEMLETGERIVNLERLYNIREELDRSEDQLPRRFTEEPISIRANITDPETGRTVLGDIIKVGRLNNFNAMLDRYYDLRGWGKDGRPEMETVQRLGLSEEARDSTLLEKG